MIIFINDVILLYHEAESKPQQLSEKQVGSLLYADDHVILPTSPGGLQHSLDKLHSYCTKWQLEVNLKKSKVMKKLLWTGKRKQLPVAWH